MPDRRFVLTAGGLSLLGAALGLPPRALAAAGLKLGEAQPFSYEGLITDAQASASRAYERGKALPESVLNRIDYDAWGKIKFNTAAALFRDGPGLYPVTFFLSPTATVVWTYGTIGRVCIT